MFCVEEYISDLIAGLKTAFGERLLYVGLQGSYLRNEATENSDIDIMAVIDGLSVGDLKEYQRVILGLGSFEKSCGFICSRADLKNWNPLEICHLLNATKDYYGELKALVPEYTTRDERSYIKLSINNLYHEICHRYIYSGRDKSKAKLPGSCKTVFYILQHIHFLHTGVFVGTKRELLQYLEGKDKEILELSISLQSCQNYDFDEAFKLLFDWCQSALLRV